MSNFKIFRPKYRALNTVWYHLSLECVGIIKADSPEHAILLAKKRGFLAPIVAPTQEKVQ